MSADFEPYRDHRKFWHALERQTFSMPRMIRRSTQQGEDRLRPEAEDQRGDGECGDAEFADGGKRDGERTDEDVEAPRRERMVELRGDRPKQKR